MYAAFVPIFPLAAQRQHEHGVDGFHKVVQRHIAPRGPANHQLALAASHRAADQRAVGEYLQGPQNLGDALWRSTCVELRDVVKKAVEVVKNLGGQLDAGHVNVYSPSLRALGLAGRSPAARAAR